MSKNRKRKLVFGKGWNDADYVTQKFEKVLVDGSEKRRQVWVCPYYLRWRDILKRCYHPSLLINRPTYKDTVVCEEWLTFSKFKAWMEKQNWKGNHLDKDLLGDGKIYSEKTCCFLPPSVNATLTSQSRESKSGLPTGVCWFEHIGKFGAGVCNPFTGKREHLGVFSNAENAHIAWYKRKTEIVEGIILHCDLSVELQEPIRNHFKLEI